MYNCQNVVSETLALEIQARMIGVLENIIDSHCGEEVLNKIRLDEELTLTERTKMQKVLSQYFPKSTHPVLIEGTIRELWKIICSRDQYIPNLVEEYVLAKAIKEHASAFDEEDSKHPVEEPKRTQIKKEIIEVMKGPHFDDITAEVFAEEEVQCVEDYSGIIDLAYYDADYELLDDYTEAELYESGMDSEYGIGTLEPARKVLPDGSLEYIGKGTSHDNITITIKG